MSGDVMQFPKTVEEFMEKYKVVDTEQVYTNGAELVPIFRMEQWFEHLRHGKWMKTGQSFVKPNRFRNYCCSVCGYDIEQTKYKYCPYCGARMDLDEVEE